MTITTKPIETPRARIVPYSASAADLDRVMRFIERMHGWQCPNCGEIYPQVELRDQPWKQPFGICPECLINDPDSIENCTPPACDHDAAILYGEILRDIDITRSMGPQPYRFPRPEPMSFLMLETLDTLLGDDKLRQVAHRRGKAYLDHTLIRWDADNHCFMPRGERPDISTPSEWSKYAQELLDFPLGVTD